MSGGRRKERRRERGGRPPLALELVLRSILIVLSQGCKWRAIDGPEASWNSIYQSYRDWSRRGVWTKLFAVVEPQIKGRRRFLDATHIKAHRCASNPPGGQDGQALGRTKGGMNTKLHAVVDEGGQAVALFLSPGNDADISHAQTVLEEVPAALVVADKAYDSDAFGQWLAARGIKPCIPPRCNRKSPARFSKPSYRKRHLVENFFERIKNFRRVATRYDKLAETFFGFACLAATLISLLW